jgi:hypothetical protein
MSVPDAGPRRRRRAPDPRLLLGILLVVGSVAGVVGIVTMSDRRVTVYAAASPLAPGERIDRGDLVERHVALDGSDGLYVGRGEIPAGGLVVTQPVAEGQLLPTSAVGSRQGVGSTTLVLQLATRVSGAVTAGAPVDLWAAPDPDATRGTTTVADDSDAVGADVIDASAPSVLVAGATVVRVLDASGSFAVDAKGSVVEVLVPRARVARVLQAIADGDALALVPAGLPVASAGGGS